MIQLVSVSLVDWSIDGGFVAVARKHNMMVLSSNFKEIFSMSLSFETWPPTDSEYTVKGSLLQICCLLSFAILNDHYLGSFVIFLRNSQSKEV